MDPVNPLHLARLQRAVDWSRRKLEPHRHTRAEMLKEFVGTHYSDDGATRTVMVNLLNMAAMIYQRALVPRNPSVMIATRHPRLKPTAYDMERWSNFRFEQMRFEDSLRRLVLESLFSVGIAKVGLEDTTRVEWEGFTHTLQDVFVDAISLDDWVHDMCAKSWETVSYAGDRYRMPLEIAREQESFIKSAREALQPMSRKPTNEMGDELASNISIGSEGDPEEIEDMVTLWEIYLPRDRKVLTLTADENGAGIGDTLLRVVDWKGPACGPYHFLGMVDVPDQTMPAGPLQQLFDLHLSANGVFRKLDRQANRQKTNTAVTGGSDADADRITNASDGDAIRVDNPDRIKEITFGGINQQNFMFFVQLKQLFEYMGGNLGAIGGLGAQAETLGQDQMIQANASKQIQEMQHRVTRFTRGVQFACCWHWWNDPVMIYEVERTVPGTDFGFVSRITPEQRQAHSFLELNFDIDPYSMQADTPSSRLQAMMQILTQVVMPAGPSMEQQGVSPAWEAILRKFAHYLSNPDLEEIIRFTSAPEPVQAGPSGEPTRKEDTMSSAPTSTTRNYVRTNRSGMTQPGFDQQMMQMIGSMNGDGAMKNGAA